MTDDRGADLQRFLEPERVGVIRALPIILVVFLGLATLVGVVVLRPTGEERPDLSEIGINPNIFEAVVVSTVEAPCASNPEVLCVDVGLRLTEGPDAGTVFPLVMVVSDTSPTFTVGERVVLDYQEDAEPEFRYSYFDRQRRPVLLWLGVLFALVVVGLGRMRGFAALVGLGASIVVLLQFVIPAILDGRDPLWVAIVGASIIAFLALYAAHGFTRMTSVALLGTLAALILTAALSWVAVEAARFSGLTVDEAFILSIAGHFDLSGLILAGTVLGALGAIDDITVTQASTVWELHALRPDLGKRGLVRSGLKVGRDHVASTVNTLLLAYAGAAMPLMLFFVLANQSIGTVLNSEIVAVEVVRTLVGSIGLVAAVPVTTWLAAVFAAEEFSGAGHGHAGARTARR
ncbi:MAG: YibE/F family protein [Acidimicrobiia bacterium]|nr:YibE/F family protein [Acidimicrobiia bacterium]